MAGRVKRQIVLLLVVIWLAASAGAAGWDEAVRLQADSASRNLFGGTELERAYRIEGPAGARGRFGWSLTTHRRTWSRGETGYVIASEGLARVAVRTRLPAVNEGVVLAAELSVFIEGDAVGTPPVIDRQQLWIYPRDAFAGRTRWLESLDIVLFDPVGATAAVWDRASLPYRRLERSELLAASNAGLIVIGEGAELDASAGVAAAVLAAVQQGTPVLWLAPADGRMALPVPGAVPAPATLSLRDPGVIAQLDPRWDGESWTEDGGGVQRMTLACEQGQVVLAVSPDAGPWVWFRSDYADPEATLVVCGLPLIARWDAGPTARFLLVQILEHVTRADASGVTR